MPDAWQTRALNLLVDQYEKSPAFRNEAKVRRVFSVSPEKIWPEYPDDFTPVEQRDRFEWEMEQLVREELVELKWEKPPRHEIRAIMAREDAWEAIYRKLGRKNARTLLREQLDFYRNAGATGITKRFARAEEERLSRRQKARYPLDRAEILINLTDRIAQNHTLLLERELSMAFFHDSKAFEKNWRKPVVDLLLQYGETDYPLEQAQNPDSEREKQAIVLAAHGVEANPSYIYLKGRISLHFQDGTEMRIPPETSVGIQTPCLEKLEGVSTDAGFVMTVENLTAYHRIREPEGICMFLSGFHRSGMEKLLRRIAEARPDMRWRHFGDLDPAGIQILKHLRRGTGLPIRPWHMGIEDLEAWQAWGKPLEAHDPARLQTLMEDPEWKPVAEWMAEHRLKLEQEWVALNLYTENRDPEYPGATG